MATKLTKKKGPVAPSRKMDGKVNGKAVNKPKPKPKPKAKTTKPKTPILFNEPEVEMFGVSGNDPMTVELMKEVLGWEEEPEGEDWGVDFLTTDFNRKKIRCNNNPTNRPFRRGLSARYASEIIRGKWAFNGETIVRDEYGMIQSGQHRGVGFVMAEQQRLLNPTKWRDDYDVQGELTLPCLLVSGISSAPEVVDTLDIGQKRTFGDVLYRDKRFSGEDGKELEKKKLQKLSNVLSHATRLVWLRAGGMKVSDAPHFPISEGLDFIKAHPRLLEAVQYIDVENQGNSISEYVSMGYAAGLLYLMMVSGTDPEGWVDNGIDALDFSMEDKAKEFWSLFASNSTNPDIKDDGNPIRSLKYILKHTSGGDGASREEIVMTIIKAFNLWIDRKKIDHPELTISRSRNDQGNVVLEEEHRLGGIDIEREVPEGRAESAAPAPKKTKKPDKAQHDKTQVGKKGKKGWAVGNTAWHTDGDGESWFGTITEVCNDEGDVLMTDALTGEEWEVKSENLHTKFDSPE
jgi:hypothetical protein